MFRRVKMDAARPAVDAQPGLGVKARGAVRLDPLDGGAALPRFAVCARVRVNAARLVEQVRLGQREAERGERAQRVADGVAGLRRGVHHIGVHGVVRDDRLTDRPPRLIRAPRRMVARGIHRLRLDAINEKIGLRVGVRRDEIVLRRHGAHHRGAAHIQHRRRASRAVAGRGCAAVGRVDDRRRRRRRGDRGRERRIVVAAIHAELRVRDEAREARIIQPARRGRGEIARPDAPCGDQLRRDEEIAARHRIVKAVNRQHIGPRVQHADERAQINLLRNQRTAFHPAARRHRADTRDRQHVAPRDLGAVQIDDATVVVAQAQRERVEVRRRREHERHAHQR